jgi:hypothetical protein
MSFVINPHLILLISVPKIDVMGSGEISWNNPWMYSVLLVAAKKCKLLVKGSGGIDQHICY